MARTQMAVEVVRFSKSEDDLASNVRVAQRPVVEPQAGQALVRIKLRPINPSDHFSVMGTYAGFQPKDLPAVPGLEGVGVVEALGSGVSNLSVGQRVVSAGAWRAAVGEGSWQTLVAADAESMLPVPDSISDENASQFLVNPVTAACFLELVPRGKWLLHNTANSALGKVLIDLAKHKGVKTLNLVRRKEAAEEVARWGGDAVVNISEVEDLPAKLREITGPEGVWEAFNPIGGAISGDLVHSLRDGGTLWIFSIMGESDAVVPMADILFRNVSVKGFWLGPFMRSLGAERARGVLQETMQAIERGRVQLPRPAKVFPLEQVHEALQAYSQLAGRGGKVLLRS